MRVSRGLKWNLKGAGGGVLRDSWRFEGKTLGLINAGDVTRHLERMDFCWGSLSSLVFLTSIFLLYNF